MRFLAAAGLIGGLSDTDSTRRHLLGSNFSSQKMRYFGGQLRASYLMEQDNHYLKPMVDVNLTHVRWDGFTETGIAATALTVGSSSETFFSVSPALELGTEWTTSNDEVVRAYLKAGATFQSNTSASLTAGFAAAPGGTPNFTIGGKTDRVAGDVEAGFTLFGDNGASLQLGYLGRFSNNSQQHGGYLKAAAKF